MPTLDFSGASNFNISGGNFNEVEGNVITYNFSNDSSKNLTPNALASIAADTAINNHAGRRGSRRERKRLTASDREPMGSPLQSAHISPTTPSHTWSSPAPSAMNLSPSPASPHRRSPRSTTFNPPVSPPSLTRSTAESSGSDSEEIITPSPLSSRHASPPTGAEGHHNAGTSGVRSPNPQNVDLLTPLTNSLGLDSRFTPAQRQEALPTVYETQTPVRSPAQSLSTVYESSGEFRLESSRPSSHSHTNGTAAHFAVPPPPPLSPRSASQASPRPSPTQLPLQLRHERPNPLGPPPPVPPRPGMLSPAWTSITAPVETPFASSRSLSVAPTTPTTTQLSPVDFNTELESATTPAVSQQELEDPATRFARLQAQRSSTKGYASGLSRSQQPTGSSGHARSPPPPPPPPPASTRPPPPLSVTGTPPANNSPSLDTAEPHASSHWTHNSISGWAGDVNGRESGGSDTQSSWESMQVSAQQPYHDQHHGYNSQHQYHTTPHNQYPNPPGPYHTQHVDNNHMGQQSYDALWGGQAPSHHPGPQQPPPFGFNSHAPLNPLAGFPFNGPAFGAPFGGPQMFGGPAFGGGFAFQR